MPHFLCNIYKCLLAGSYLTKIKDWVFFKFMRHTFCRDPVRERTVDELTSVAIWVAMIILSIELMSLEFNVALGSMVALGGIGSASLALAFKVSVENIISGIILKVRDIFRVGDVISLTGSERGTVQELSYLSTSVRRQDNSVVSIPNRDLIGNEVVNWSRTPFRLFKTSLAIDLKDIEKLPDIMQCIRNSLEAIKGIETGERELFVAACGFKGTTVEVQVEAHFKATDEMTLSELRSQAVNAIAACISRIKK